jgi:hypothetical protein
MALSAIQLVWLDRVKDTYVADEFCQNTIASLPATPDSVPNFTWIGGILRYKHKIWVGNSKVLHNQILSTVHGSSLGGHSGFPVTYRKLK